VEPPAKGEGPAAYLVDGLLRLVNDELIVRFKPRVSPERCHEILQEAGFVQVQANRFVGNQWIVRHRKQGVAGERLLAKIDAFKKYSQVLFAWPNSLAEYIRASGVAAKTRRWWLDEIGVNWSTGNRRLAKGSCKVVIAVLDDGVDIEHPNLASRVPANHGKDFTVAENLPGHFDPRPKVRDPTSNPNSDYHGTLCAGLICSDGTKNKFLGVAPGCRLVAIRVMAGGNLVYEGAAADAIHYATGVADVISCSWWCLDYPAVGLALEATSQGRGGKGAAVFCAAGNQFNTVIDFPARHAKAIAVGACDRDGNHPLYSNQGAELAIVAPTSDEIDSYVYSTDVSRENWGYNTSRNGSGLFYTRFGKTSAATAIAAGVGALCFSVNPSLTAGELRDVLQKTAVKVGGVTYDANGHHDEFGHGCIDAAEAVAEAVSMLPP
jgi:subtilisin family serine protease